MEKVLIYTTTQCPFCTAAKNLLKSRDIAFEEKTISWEDEKEWDSLLKKSGMQTVPQIFFQDRLIGGYTELAKQDSLDQLQSLK